MELEVQRSIGILDELAVRVTLPGREGTAICCSIAQTRTDRRDTMAEDRLSWPVNFHHVDGADKVSKRRVSFSFGRTHAA